MTKSRKSSGMLDLERDLPTGEPDLKALKRSPALTEMDFAHYLEFLRRFGPADRAALRHKKGPCGSEPFDLGNPDRS
jgi:hypothetical protein